MIQDVKSHIVIFLFLLAALLVYFSPAIKAGALSTFDLNYAYPPFELIKPGEIGNPLLSDQARGGDPSKYYIGRSYREGRIPLWNPYNALGIPFLANLQSAVFFPPNLLFAILPFGMATIAVAIVKLLVAGVGMYLLVWALSQNRLIALFAGIAFSFSGFNIVWLGHPHSNVSIWLPWLLLFTWQFFRTRRRTYLLPYALVVALQFFGGHIETSLHILSLTGLLAVILTFMKRDWLSFLLFSVVSILGFLLAAPQLFPFIEYLFNSFALAFRSRITRASYMTLPWLIPSFLPNLFGNPTWHAYWFQPHKFFNYNETVMGFPGTLSLFLSPFVLFSSRWRRWGLGIILLILAMVLGMLGVPPFFTFLSKVPLFSLSSNVRLLFLTSFLMIVLAALALNELAGAEVLEKGFNRSKDWVRRNRATLFLGVFAVLILLVVFFAALPGVRALVYRVVTKTSQNFNKGPRQAFFQFGFAFTACAVLLTLKLRRLITARLFLVIVMILALFDGYLYSWNYNPPFSGELFATTPEIEYVQQNAGYDRALIFAQGKLPVIYGIYDPHSGDSLVYHPVVQFMNLAGAKNRLRELEVTAENKRFLDFLNVRYFAFKKEKEEDLHFAFKKGERVNIPGLEKVFEGNSVNIYQNEDVFPRAFTPEKVISVGSADEALALLGASDFGLRKTVTVEGGDEAEFEGLTRGTASLESYEPERVTLSVSCPGSCFLTLTDINYPGWVADLDGERTTIYKTDVAFRGVYIPEGGDHTIEFAYVPRVFQMGIAASVLALIALLGLAFVSIKA